MEAERRYISQAAPIHWSLRLVWFVLVGWWASFTWINTAWFFNTTIVLLPLGLWMLNRVPQVLTLQSESIVVETRLGRDGGLVQRELAMGQKPFIIRALWFVFVGWWLSFFWANVAWLISATIIGLPLSVWMLNRLPAVTTLRHN